MVKSPAHWEQPASDKASAAAEQKQLKPGKSDLRAPKDSDWHFAGKQQGRGFSDCALQVNRYSDNPAAQAARQVSEHRYQVPSGAGAGVGSARIQQQNRLASKRK